MLSVTVCDNVGVEMGISLQGRDFFSFHFLQYLPFVPSLLLHNKAEGPCAAGGREILR